MRVDHLAFSTASIERSRDRLSALGFTLSALATYHQAHTLESWTTTCMFLENVWFDLLLGSRPSDELPHARGDSSETLSAIALGCRSFPTREQVLLEGRLRVGPAYELVRTWDPGAGLADDRFRLARLHSDRKERPSCVLVEETPRPNKTEWLRHPNGATSLDSIEVVLGDGCTVLWNELLHAPDKHGRTIDCTVDCTDRDTFLREHGLETHDFPKATSLGSLVFGSIDIDAVAALLRSNGVPFRRCDRRLEVAYGFALSCIVVFQKD